ncbi:MAG: RNHCP domain-containing protein [Candidatus Moranbacteria bacterium]|nr:RNHCP domain-containing protein [Candidatus Moranbacteria bacterium]
MQNFTCKYCGKKVDSHPSAGIKNRNHCPFCLYSVHLDKEKAGDRLSRCQSLMRPTGLTFKKIKPDKYRRNKKGELMIIHKCQKCDKLSINRLAWDDNNKKIFDLFEKSLQLNVRESELISKQGIEIIEKADEDEILSQIGEI